MPDELVKAEPAKQEVAVRVELPEWLQHATKPTFSTFDLSSDDGIKMMSRASISADIQIGDMVDKEIEIQSWMMSPYEKLEAASGEMMQLVYVALVDPAGKVYGGSSSGVRQSILLLSSQFGFKPWIPAIRVKVRSMKAAVGKMFALEFVGRSDDKSKSAKVK